MKRTVKTLALCLLVSLLLPLLFACGGGSVGDGIVIPEGMIYVGGDERYTFFAPESFTPDRVGAHLMAYASSVDPSNITLAVTEGEDPAAYFAAQEGALRESLTAYAPVSADCSDEAKLGDRTAIRRVYTASFDGVGYKIMQLIAEKDGLLYLFTYTARTEEYNNGVSYFDLWLEKVNAAAAAFLFRGEEEGPKAEGDAPLKNEDGLLLVSNDKVNRYRLYLPEAFTPTLQSGITQGRRENGASFTLSYEIPMEDNIEQYWNSVKKGLDELYGGITYIAEESSVPVESESEIVYRMAGHQAARYVYTFEAAGVPMKGVKTMVVEGVYIYTLTYVAPVSVFSPSELDTVIGAFEFK